MYIARRTHAHHEAHALVKRRRRAYRQVRSGNPTQYEAGTFSRSGWEAGGGPPTGCRAPWNKMKHSNPNGASFRVLAADADADSRRPPPPQAPAPPLTSTL